MEKREREEGILYVVGTPIGNLKDITLRAIEVLQEADFVVAESRERALKLLSHLNIRKPVTTINSYNESSRAKAVVNQLLEGKMAALISAAGTPCISDPGDIVVRRSLEAGIRVEAVPGPSAAIAALSVSGLSPDRFFFYGFLPLKKGKKKKLLREALDGPHALVVYESPRRIVETLEIIREEAPERMVAVYREMTKLHEETIRGTIGEVVEQIQADGTRGEYTVVVEGRRKQAAGEREELW
jgi:16S rRNA (cytidine1402-2'-O)-methyltransferase